MTTTTKPACRPPINGRKRLIKLTDDQAERAKVMGEGNVSRGVRVAIDTAYRNHPWKQLAERLKS